MGKIVKFFFKNNLTTVKDCIEGQLGPLVGILTAMKWAKKNSNKYTSLYPDAIWATLALYYDKLIHYKSK
mgnify:CR=1 FL=1